MPRRVSIIVDADVLSARRALNALSTDLTAIKNQRAAINRVEEDIVQSRILGPGGRLGSGIFTGDPTADIRTTFDRFQNTIRQTSTITKGGIDTTLTTYAGNYEKAVTALDAYRRQLERVAPIERRAARDISSLGIEVAGAAVSYETLARAQYSVVSAPVRGPSPTGRGRGPIIPGVFKPVGLRDTETGQYVGGADAALAARYLDAQLLYEQSQADINRRAPYLKDYYQDYVNARNAPSPIPPNIGQIARESPDLMKKLARAGIAGAGGNVAGLYETGAAQSFKVQEDLVRQVTRVTGSFTDQNNVLKRINAEYDRSGGLVTRFSGRLSGLGSALTQIGRDYLKVAEFALATIGVYGALNKIGETVGTILTLDKGLRQLGITANLTTEQSKGLFSQLADIGIETATPLTQIIGTADGVALAVRKIGDSAEETSAKIISFTRSVGILTNLSGIDAVKATDLLTSAYKQLGLTVDQIPSLLDKITAVAGGQSNAIADVVEAVAQLGEAAKVGGLDISELVGTVLTLSQVTAKSPKEVATSLKNLIGSIGSPGSIKALDSYGIHLHDLDGNLKDILEIYGEIQAKFRSGVVPEGEQQALIRAISGGPRRAPDAAALLGSYNQIANAVRIASDASNESTIANLKVLDSAQAKLVQLQAAFDKFTFGKFGEIVQHGAENLLDIFTGLFEFLDKIDPSLYELLGTLALVTVGTKALGFVFNTLFGAGVRILENIGLMPAVLNRAGAAAALVAQNFKQLALAEVEASIAARGNLAAPLTGPVNSGVASLRASRIAKSGGIRGIALPIGAGIATGVGLDLATGASPKGLLQNALLGLGFGALAIPEPTISKILAGVGIISGSLLALIPDEKKVAEAHHATTEELLQSLTAYRQASSALQAIKKDDDDLTVSITRLREKQKTQTLTAEELQALSGAQDQYAKNALASIDANVQLQESFDDLRKNIENIKGLTDEVKLKIKLAVDGEIDQESLKELTARITEEFLKAADPERYKNISDFEFKVPVTLDVITTVKDSDQLNEIARFLQIPRGTTDLGPNTDRGEAAKFYFPYGTGASEPGQAPGTPSPTYFPPLQSGITKEQLRDSERYKAALDQIAIDAQYLTNAGLLHLISADEVDRGQKLLDFLKDAINLRKQYTPPPASPQEVHRGGVTPESQLIDAEKELLNIQNIVFASRANGFKLTEEQAISAGRSFALLAGRFDLIKDKDQLLIFTKDLFTGMGYEIEWTTGKVDELNEALAKVKADNVKSIVQGYQSNRTDLFGQRNKIEAQIQGEKFTPATTKEDIAAKASRIKGYKEELAQINALINANTILKNELLKLNEVDPEGLKEFKLQLAQIHGLEVLSTTSTENLASTLVGIAETFGLTGEQVGIFITAILQLIKNLRVLDGLKTTITIERDIITRWTSVGEDPYAGTAAPGGGSPLTPAHQSDYDALLEENKRLKKVIDDLLDSGKGTKLGDTSGGGGGSTKTPKVPDYARVDLDENIKKSEIAGFSTQKQDLATIQQYVDKILGQLPKTERDKLKDNNVLIFDGLNKIATIQHADSSIVSKAMQELADIEKKRLDFETKADTIRRIRVGAGDFAAIANVPFNSQTGVSAGGPEGPINVNINGQILTPAQLNTLANQIAAIIKRNIASAS